MGAKGNEKVPGDWGVNKGGVGRCRGGGVFERDRGEREKQAQKCTRNEGRNTAAN